MKKCKHGFEFSMSRSYCPDCEIIELREDIKRQQVTIDNQQAALDAVDKLRRKYINRTIDKGNLETCIVVTDLKEALAKNRGW